MLFYLIKTCFYNFCFEKKTNILTFVLRKILNALWLPICHALPSLFSRKASTQAFHSQPAKARRRCVLGVTPVNFLSFSPTFNLCCGSEWERKKKGTWRREEGVHGRGRANQGVVLGVPTHVVEGSSNCFLLGLFGL
ncbi:hypothetical protein ES332_A05G449200v1 [Gossypium tomentosum]|uniref:Uncharacterized protein n=1 Tax=Gossypium tomentosum TaxID=34277 RepID=A0A5D2QS01_GOSTO|nr:hypothetical protein ES332_A05G449200v1 [Gossypium tomentosum]